MTDTLTTRWIIEPTKEIRQIEAKVLDWAREAVQKGAALLDEKHPRGTKWPDLINPAELILSNVFACVLGQVYGHYNNGVTAIINDDNGAWELGFQAPTEFEMGLTYDEMGVVSDFERKSADAWHDVEDSSEHEQVRTWEITTVVYGSLNYAWRELMVERGYEANGTPLLALMHREWDGEHE